MRHFIKFLGGGKGGGFLVFETIYRRGGGGLNFYSCNNPVKSVGVVITLFISEPLEF